MSSGSGKNLKSWGKVVQALQKAWQEQEIWKAAQVFLLATLRLGIGVVTQIVEETDPAKRKDARLQGHFP